MTVNGRMTIDELARRANTTTRNIRNYQTMGLLPPPELVGRVGYYCDDHLGRLRLIAGLQGQGFSLAGIHQLLSAWEEGRSLGDLLGFERVLTQPWADEEPERFSLEELVEMFPEAVSDPTLGPRSVELGLLEVDDEGFVAPSPSLLRSGADLAAAGVPLSATQDELAALRQDMARIAQRFVGLFERWVWQPFVEAGMPSEGLPEVTEALQRMRPVAAVAVGATLAQAMDAATASSTAAQVMHHNFRPDTRPATSGGRDEREVS